jgi:trehalose synthase
MRSPEENALMVNALQRCSSVVAQNSLQEGFGLTVTEAMWKARPVLGTRAAGIRAQVTDGEHGRLVSDPENPEEITATLGEMLEDESSRRAWGRNARARVAERYLTLAQVRRWLEVLSSEYSGEYAPGHDEGRMARIPA